MRKLLAPLDRLFKNRELIFVLSCREITDRYKGQPMGRLWAFIHPLMMILIYIVLFAVIFKTKIQSTVYMPQSFAAYILSGMIPWICFQNSMIGGAASVINNGSFIRQVIFPVEVFPTKMMGAAVIIEVIYLGINLIYNIAFEGNFFWTYFLIPVMVIIQSLFLIGINYFTSSIGAYWRDIKDFVQIFSLVGVYIAPIVYLPDAVPHVFKFMLYCNPFSYYIWLFQDVMYFGQIMHPEAWMISCVISVITFYIGDAVFQKLKISFGSVV